MVACSPLLVYWQLVSSNDDRLAPATCMVFSQSAGLYLSYTLIINLELAGNATAHNIWSYTATTQTSSRQYRGYLSVFKITYKNALAEVLWLYKLLLIITKSYLEWKTSIIIHQKWNNYTNLPLHWSSSRSSMYFHCPNSTVLVKPFSLHVSAHTREACSIAMHACMHTHIYIYIYINKHTHKT